MVEVSYESRVRLIVEADQFHAPAEKSAVLVAVLSPDLVRQLSCFAVRCEGTRERQTISILTGDFSIGPVSLGHTAVPKADEVYTSSARKLYAPLSTGARSSCISHASAAPEPPAWSNRI